MEKLTKRQNDVLNVILEYCAQFGYPPTVREIGKELKISSPATVYSHLKKLEEKEYIKTGNKKSRGIQILIDNHCAKSDNSILIPLLGKTSAGSPIEAIENPNEYFEAPSNLIPAGKEIFALNVDGDSMVNKGIYDNDIVIIEKNNNPNNGDVVVAMTNEFEVTLKTFYKEKDHFRLQPENDLYEPLILNELTVLGKAIGLYRQL